MIPEVSAGSNQVGASEKWVPQVRVPAAASAKAASGAPAIVPAAPAASTCRRVGRRSPPVEPGTRRRRSDKPICTSPEPATVHLGFGFDRDLLVGTGIREGRDQAEAGLADPRAVAVDERQLPDRCNDRLFGYELLDLLQHLAAFLDVH